ncbi:hypothetical protein B8W95_13840, partial [Staphylococcus pasteuri]
ERPDDLDERVEPFDGSARAEKTTHKQGAPSWDTLSVRRWIAQVEAKVLTRAWAAHTALRAAGACRA